MSNKFILFLGVFALLFTEYSFSQNFVQDISSYQIISADDFVKSYAGQSFFIRMDYPQSNFEKSAEELEKLYFGEVSSSLERTDSLSVSNNFKKLPRTLSKQYRKETKRLVKKLERLNVMITHDTSSYTVEPRYLLRIEKPNPIAYTISLEYILIDESENKTCRIKL